MSWFLSDSYPDLSSLCSVLEGSRIPRLRFLLACGCRQTLVEADRQERSLGISTPPVLGGPQLDYKGPASPAWGLSSYLTRLK